jgi:hypothetical protein
MTWMQGLIEIAFIAAPTAAFALLLSSSQTRDGGR